jgi:phosphoserine phosphatase
MIPEGVDATLVLVRHGESQFIVEGRFQGRADSPLSPRGREQAARVARRLADPAVAPALPIPLGPPQEVVHSPLGRAAETAAAIAGARSPAVPLRADDSFLEIGQGAWEGLHRDEVQARYGSELAAWRRRPTLAWAPGGESIPAAADRVRGGLQTVLGRLADGRAAGTLDRSQVAGYGDVHDGPWSVVVAHDGIFKVLLLTLFDLPLERFWMWSFELCGIAVVDLRAGRPVLRGHNLGSSGTVDAADLIDAEARAASGAL